MHLLKNQRLELAMVGASLLVVCLVVALLFNYQRESSTTQLQTQGVNLVRLLSGLSYEQLVPVAGSKSALQLLRASQEGSDFAYAFVVAPGGDILAEVTAPGFVIPEQVVPQDLSHWQGERTVRMEASGREVIEFYAPIIVAEEVLANIRLGFFRPGYGLSMEQLPFFGTLALAVFMLAPLFHFALKRAIQPIHAANQKMGDLLDEATSNGFQIQASAELGDFMNRFNHFMGAVKSRIETLEAENTGLETSKKLLSYRSNQLQSVLDALPDAVMIIDRSGKVTYVNGKVEALLGASKNEILNSPPESWCKDPEVLSLLAKQGNKSSDSNAAMLDETLRFKPRQAPLKKLSRKILPIFSQQQGGQLHGNVVVFHDVSREALAEQGRANFVAHVAHELKTPLNTLALYAEALRDGDRKDEAFGVEACNVISDEVERLAALVGNLLNITKMEMGNLKLERQRVRLRDLLKDALDQLSKGARESDLTFEFDVPKELSAVAIDKDLFRIAIHNLLSNAIKYNKRSGQITLAASETDDLIEIRITDTGIGIPLEEQERIFEKFYRANEEQVRERSGHGLGLPLAKEIIELHRGQLSVRSTPGEGTEFTIRLPKEIGLIQQAI